MRNLRAEYDEQIKGDTKRYQLATRAAQKVLGEPKVMRYKRNEAVADILHAHPTAGLPLFQNENKGLSKRDQYLATEAPKAIPIATDTRKLSHIGLTLDPDILTKKQLWVFNAFRELQNLGHDDATNEEIRVHLNTRINLVVGRTFELREKGVIGKSQKRKCRVTGNVVTAWTIITITK